MKTYFVTGIGTDIGKTIVSAILVEALQADYFKPIQAGDLNNSDTIKVKNLVNNKSLVFHPETYRLKKPMSPHAAADFDGVKIELPKIKLPKTKNNLIIEGAGGVMVPLNDKQLVIDLISKLKTEVILVSQNYLGSINHTILTFEALKNKGIKMAGIVFNGKTNQTSEDYILKYTGLKCILRIKQEKEITPKTIAKYSKLVQL
jgi:dethiobiotin synthetase